MCWDAIFKFTQTALFPSTKTLHFQLKAREIRLLFLNPLSTPPPQWRSIVLCIFLSPGIQPPVTLNNIRHPSPQPTATNSSALIWDKDHPYRQTLKSTHRHGTNRHTKLNDKLRTEQVNTQQIVYVQLKQVYMWFFDAFVNYSIAISTRHWFESIYSIVMCRHIKPTDQKSTGRFRICAKG